MQRRTVLTSWQVNVALPSPLMADVICKRICSFYYTARTRFGPFCGEPWTAYSSWAGLTDVNELISFDEILCPNLIENLTDEDWKHNVQARSVTLPRPTYGRCPPSPRTDVFLGNSFGILTPSEKFPELSTGDLHPTRSRPCWACCIGAGLARFSKWIDSRFPPDDLGRYPWKALAKNVEMSGNDFLSAPCRDTTMHYGL